MTSSEVEQTPPPPGSHPNFCWEFGAYPVRSWGLGGGRTGRHSREDKVRRPPEGAGPTGGGLSQRVALGGRRRGSDCPRRGAGELGLPHPAPRATWRLRGTRPLPGRARERVASVWASLASVALGAGKGCGRRTGLSE